MLIAYCAVLPTRTRPATQRVLAALRKRLHSVDRCEAVRPVLGAWRSIAEDSRRRRAEALFDAMSAQVQAAKLRCKRAEFGYVHAAAAFERYEEVALRITVISCWRDVARRRRERWRLCTAVDRAGTLWTPSLVTQRVLLALTAWQCECYRQSRSRYAAEAMDYSSDCFRTCSPDTLGASRSFVSMEVSSQRRDRLGTARSPSSARFVVPSPGDCMESIGGQRQQSFSYCPVARGDRVRSPRWTVCSTESALSSVPTAAAQLPVHDCAEPSPLTAGTSSSTACHRPLRRQPSLDSSKRMIRSQSSADCGTASVFSHGPMAAADWRVVGGAQAVDRDAPMPTAATDVLAAESRRAKGPERFFYDISGYTGCARFGGPSVVDKENRSGNLRANRSGTLGCASARTGIVSQQAGAPGVVVAAAARRKAVMTR